MSQNKVIQFHDWIFRILRYYGEYTSEATDDNLSDMLSDIINVNISGKADKLTDFEVGNFVSVADGGNIADSGFNANSFALVSHHHDNRYLRINGDNRYYSDSHTFTWVVADGVPFVIDNGSGDILPVVTHLNADKLDGKDASEFAPVVHSHSQYANKRTGDTIDGVFVFKALFELDDSIKGILVPGLNADKLDGKDASEFVTASHNHDDRYYQKSEIDGFLSDKATIPPENTQPNEIALFIDNKGNLKRSNKLIGDMATVSQLDNKVDKVNGVPTNFVMFGLGMGTITDSGVNASSFAPVLHNHDADYYRKEEFLGHTLQIELAETSTIGIENQFIVGFRGISGIEPLPANVRRFIVRVNGVEYSLLAFED